MILKSFAILLGALSFATASIKFSNYLGAGSLFTGKALDERQSGVSFNDAVCDEQLRLFSEALSARELWALRREIKLINSKDQNN